MTSRSTSRPRRSTQGFSSGACSGPPRFSFRRLGPQAYTNAHLGPVRRSKTSRARPSGRSLSSRWDSEFISRSPAASPSDASLSTTSPASLRRRHEHRFAAAGTSVPNERLSLLFFGRTRFLNPTTVATKSRVCTTSHNRVRGLAIYAGKSVSPRSRTVIRLTNQ